LDYSLNEPLNFGLNDPTEGIFLRLMSMTVTMPAKNKHSRAALEAGDRLLKAVKEKLLREHRTIDYADLRQKGYSDAIIARLKEI
jgi:hypothetical protein